MSTSNTRRKILVVDDQVVICDVISEFLSEWAGTEIECARRGDDGAALLRSNDYDCALIDAMLPGVLGVALAEIAVTRGIPVLILSGHPEIAIRLEAVNFPYLAKPFKLDDLMALTKQILSNPSVNILRVKVALQLIKMRSER